MRKSRQKANTGNVTSITDMQNEGNINPLNISETSRTKKERRIKYASMLRILQENVSLKENQLEYSKKIENNTITFVTGAAGSSKTWTACYTLLKLLFEQKIDKIIFTKPVKESGENLGFLPGSVEEKLLPYMESFVYTCKQMLGDAIVKTLIENNYIENRPLAYMRGITFDNCGLFLDEAQNCLYEQFILYITRLGKNSKIVIAGDVTQRDIEKKKVCMPEFIEMIGDLPGVTVHTFKKTDIVRNPLLIQITERYEDWKDKKEIQDAKERTKTKFKLNKQEVE